nr:hypothetical protein [uncultured Deefgea sp.]
MEGEVQINQTIASVGHFQMRFEILPHQINEKSSLIYMWEIRSNSGELLGRYIGKAKAGAKRPRTHYYRNVVNILAGKAYRKGNPDGYRRIHIALADAHRAGNNISLVFLCNVQPDENINEAEQRCIKEWGSRGCETWQLNG